MNIKGKKEFLKQKMVDFQREISTLRKTLGDTENSYESKATQFHLQFIDLLDTLENIENNAREKERENALDNYAAKLLKNIVSAKNKTLRILKANHIEKIEFPDNKAVREYSVIVETQPSENQENETILEVLKAGYINNKSRKTVRKAELITVLNH